MRVNKEAADRFIFTHLGMSKEAMGTQSLQQFSSSHRIVTQQPQSYQTNIQDEPCKAEEVEKAEKIKQLFLAI